MGLGDCSGLSITWDAKLYPNITIMVLCRGDHATDDYYGHL